MNSCNVHNRNVHIANSINHHSKPWSVSKLAYSCNVPVFCKSSKKSVCKIIDNRQVFNPVWEFLIVNHSKRHKKQSFSVNSNKHGVTKSFNVKYILMTSICFYELVVLFFIFHHNVCNFCVDNFLKGYITRNNFSINNFLNYDRKVW